jgi:NADPH:quinone reductase-like Zn-dependent oxidoreductase
MIAAVFHEFGGPDQVRIEEVPTPRPGPGEVRIAVRAAALNHLDLWARRGLPDVPLPHIGGSDIAGVIDEVGEGVSSPAVGDPVVVDPTLSCGMCGACTSGEEPLCARFCIIGEHCNGGFAAYVVVPAANTYVVPRDQDLTVAAAAPLPFLTAWRGLISRGRLVAGETVLVTGASGGVAIAAIAIARLCGAHVLAITSTEHVEQVHALGVDDVFDRRDPDHRRQLWQRTSKRGVDLVFDSVGAVTWHDNLRALARGGRLVTYGATTGHAAQTDIRYVFWRQIEIIGTTMSNRTEFRTVMDLVFGGRLQPVIDVTWPLSQAREAHERLERGEHFGKIVLVP